MCHFPENVLMGAAAPLDLQAASLPVACLPGCILIPVKL